MSNSGWQKGICLSVPQKPKLYLIHASKTALTRKCKRERGKSHPALNVPSHFTGHNKSHGHDWLQKDRKNREQNWTIYEESWLPRSLAGQTFNLFSFLQVEYTCTLPAEDKLKLPSSYSIKLKDQIYGWYGNNLSIMSRCGPSLQKPIY